MDVLAALERGDQPGVVGQVGDAAQLDLVVVGDEELPARLRDEGPPEEPALVGAHRDVVQVGLVGRQPAGARDGLVEGGVDATVGPDLAQEPLAVGRPELLDLPVGEERVDQLGPLVAQALERRGVGGEAGLGALLRRQPALVEQDLAQLRRRVEVERPARDQVHLLLQPLAVLGEPLVELAQLVDVDARARRAPCGPAPARAGSRSRRRAGASPGASSAASTAGASRFTARAARAARWASSTADPPRSSWPAAASSVGHRVRRVALEQLAERVAVLGRVEEVGGDGRVERSARRSMPRSSSERSRALALWARRGRSSLRADRTARSSRCSAGTHATSAASASSTTARPSSGERPSAPPTRPPRRAPRAWPAAGPTPPATRCGATSASSTSPPPIPGATIGAASTSREPLEQRAELEEVEQPLHLGGVLRSPLQAVEVDLDRDVAQQDHHVGVLAHPGLVLGQRGPQLGVWSSRWLKMPSRPP